MFSRSRSFNTTSYAQLLESRAQPKERVNSHTVLANSARKRFGTEPEISRRPGLGESTSDDPRSASSTSNADRTTWSRPGAGSGGSSSSPRPGSLECQLCFEDLEHAERYQCRECPDVCLCSNCVINSSIVHSSDNTEHIFELSKEDGRGPQADGTSLVVAATRSISEGAGHSSVGDNLAHEDANRPGLSDGSLDPVAATRTSTACQEARGLGSDDSPNGLTTSSPRNGAGDAIPGFMSPQWAGRPQISAHHTHVQTGRIQRRKQSRPRPQLTPSRMPVPLAREGIFEFLCRAADQYFQYQTSSIEARIERRIAQRIERRIEQRVMARLSRQLCDTPDEDEDGADNEDGLGDDHLDSDEAAAEDDLRHDENDDDSDSGSSLNRILDFTFEDLGPPRTRRNRPWLPRDKRQLRELKGQGVTEEEIGIQLGRSPGAVSQQWRKLRTAARQ